MKSAGLRVFFMGNFEIINLISLLFIDLFSFSIFFFESMIVCVFLGICPFHLGYLIFWHTVFHRIIPLSYFLFLED